MNEVKCKHKLREDCYYEREEMEWQCRKCIHNVNADSGETQDHYISIRDKVNELYSYLCGIRATGKFTSKQAFSIIYFLQEHMYCIPCNIEQCCMCNELYDTDCEGFSISDGMLGEKEVPKKYNGFYCSEECIPQKVWELISD